MGVGRRRGVREGKGKEGGRRSWGLRWRKEELQVEREGGGNLGWKEGIRERGRERRLRIRGSRGPFLCCEVFFFFFFW